MARNSPRGHTIRPSNCGSAATGKCLKTLEGHSDDVRSVAFSPNGKMIVSGSRDDTVKLWSIVTGECLRTLKGHTNAVYSVAFSPRWQYDCIGKS